MSNKRKITTYFTCSTKSPIKHANEKNSKIPKIITENEVVDLPAVDFNVHDIGCYINSTLTDADRYLILKDVWIPPATYTYPLLDCNAKRGLKFKHHWLNAHNWLAYSEKYQGAFCKFCVVFSKVGGVGGQKLGTLVVEAFTNYKKATEVFKKHGNLEYHKTALLKSDNFLNVYSNKSSSIINLIDSERTKQIEINRKRLIPIIECIMLCGQQEIALRGHRDYGPICFSRESNENEGNFRAILKYKAKDIDYMKSYLETESKNKYISNRTQNEIIETCGDIILKKIVKIVNESGFFSVLVDETTDVSVKEQLTLCVRYLSGSGENVCINESFLKFIEVQSLTGENLTKVILNVISLEDISSWKDTAATDASILIRALDSEFLVSLQIVNVLFSYGLPLCKLLQSKGIDLKEAIDLAGDNVTVLKNLRTNISTEFNKMFKKAQEMAEFLDFHIKIKRINKRQIYRDNPNITDDGSTPDPEQYFRVSICLPYIDFFINQLEDRFLAHRRIFGVLFYILINNS
ncbi:uncharacterized protein LOC112684865 isoform X2 [Sipha flava]|uniref:Uncharacterized protein LOC112684865 isoform X2 n=1 Tax=Sipha flava TaxID=143950 RepID=A0A8B8FPF3_9HEMI|nr:uncharacterized protein LOC112684865 isoform X2 [Sipha flava]